MFVKELTESVVAHMAMTANPLERRVIQFLPPFLACLAWMRDRGIIDFNVAEIRYRMAFFKVLEIVNPLRFLEMPESLKNPLRRYLVGLPGYRAECGYGQCAAASGLHDRVAAQIESYFDLETATESHVPRKALEEPGDRVLVVGLDNTSRIEAFRELADGSEMLVVDFDHANGRTLAEILPVSIEPGIVLVLDNLERVASNLVSSLCLFIEGYQGGPLHFGARRAGLVSNSLLRRSRHRRLTSMSAG